MRSIKNNSSVLKEKTVEPFYDAVFRALGKLLWGNSMSAKKQKMS